ncbi:hypothetical protein SD457_13895 [Coprobacillaceae bacterium CR2/5/TPMF4]|nr:hypothetical protein SD457_13895 [Coprobacillaceae bacterium CR2/5/TPMF4]
MKSKEIARKLNYNYLRLLVVDFNYPAINLYLKNGFVKKKVFIAKLLMKK